MNQCYKHNGVIFKFDGPSCPECAKLKKNHPTSEAAKLARELTRANSGEWDSAFAKFIQRVSGVVEEYLVADYRREQGDKVKALRALILPKPVDDMQVIANKLGVTKRGLIACVEAEGYEIRKAQP